MFESRTKQVTRYFLTIDGEKIRFRTKRLAIRAGKTARTATEKDIRLTEEYDLFTKDVNGNTILLDHREFDRSNLLTP